MGSKKVPGFELCVVIVNLLFLAYGSSQCSLTNGCTLTGKEMFYSIFLMNGSIYLLNYHKCAFRVLEHLQYKVWERTIKDSWNTGYRVPEFNNEQVLSILG